MTPRFLVHTSALALLLVAPAAASAQGVTINHEEVGCIVAGKFPKMNACFAPASLVKKPRVYFRPETLSTWYYVEMTSDAPCFSGVLLKPSKSLIDKKIFYYVEVQGGDSRTPEYAPVVVASQEACKSERPVAPLSAGGPAAVFPSLPAGFVGPAGLSTGVVAAGVAAVALAAGGTKLLTDDGSPTTTLPTTPTTNPPATTPTTTLPPPPVGTSPLVVACQASPRSGEAPLRVSFATFPSGGTGSYQFLWSFGDGGSDPNPNPSHTYLTPGAFDATVQVRSGDQIAACSRPITVTTPPTTTPPSAPPTFALNVSLSGSGSGVVTGPGINCPGDCTEAYVSGTLVTLTATPQGAPPTVFKQWTGDCTGSGPCVLTMNANKSVVAQFERVFTLNVNLTSSFFGSGAVTSRDGKINCTVSPGSPPAFSAAALRPGTCSATYVSGEVAILDATPGDRFTSVSWGSCPSVSGNTCTVTMNADTTVSADFSGSAGLTGGPAPGGTAVPVTVSTQLEVPDGEGQVVMNGRIAHSARNGLSVMTAERRHGSNRVEAVLVRGAERSGTWRFDFSGQAAFRPGSLRIVAGTAALITDDTVVFRLQGKSGERIVFTFEVE